jgi:hypothetical protein
MIVSEMLQLGHRLPVLPPLREGLRLHEEDFARSVIEYLFGSIRVDQVQDPFVLTEAPCGPNRRSVYLTAFLGCTEPLDEAHGLIEKRAIITPSGVYFDGEERCTFPERILLETLFDFAQALDRGIEIPPLGVLFSEVQERECSDGGLGIRVGDLFENALRFEVAAAPFESHREAQHASRSDIRAPAFIDEAPEHGRRLGHVAHREKAVSRLEQCRINEDTLRVRFRKQYKFSGRLIVALERLEDPALVKPRLTGIRTGWIGPEILIKDPEGLRCLAGLHEGLTCSKKGFRSVGARRVSLGETEKFLRRRHIHAVAHEFLREIELFGLAGGKTRRHEYDEKARTATGGTPHGPEEQALQLDSSLQRGRKDNLN